MNRRLTTFLGLLGLLLLVGCANPAKQFGPIELVSAERLGSSGLELQLRLPNRSRHPLLIEQGEATLYYRGAELLRAELRGEVVIEERSDHIVTTRWRLRSNDPGALLLCEKLLREERYEELAADYRVQVRYRGLKRNFSGQKVPLSENPYTFRGVTPLLSARAN